MDRELWIASGNPNKRDELARLLDPLGVTLRLRSEARGAPEVVEDRPDFAGNARKKAEALAAAVGAVAVADDSGLSVDALGGRPGVLSARYAGPDASDDERIARLLAELAGFERTLRGARFTCSLALCGPDGGLRAAVEEHCEGRIAEAARGGGGFGYDPVFVPDAPAAGGHTFAELEPADKDAISHRGRALRRLAALIAEDPDLLRP